MQPANPSIDDLARTNIALHRLSLVHLRCVEIAQMAEAAEQEGTAKANAARAGELEAAFDDDTDTGVPL